MSKSFRLSREDWNTLDNLLGKHGFGGYYDLIESLKMIAGDLGIGNIGLDLSDSMSLPQIVSYLRDWSQLLSKDPVFPDLALKVSREVEIRKESS